MNVTNYKNNAILVAARPILYYVYPILFLFEMFYLCVELRHTKGTNQNVFRKIAILFVLSGNFFNLIYCFFGTTLSHNFGDIEFYIAASSAAGSLLSYLTSVAIINFWIKDMLKKSLAVAIKRKTKSVWEEEKKLIIFSFVSFISGFIVVGVAMATKFANSAKTIAQIILALVLIPSFVTIYSLQIYTARLLRLLRLANESEESQNKNDLMLLFINRLSFYKSYGLRAALFWAPFCLSHSFGPMLSNSTYLVIFVAWVTPITWVSFAAGLCYFLSVSRRQSFFSLAMSKGASIVRATSLTDRSKLSSFADSQSSKYSFMKRNPKVHDVVISDTISEESLFEQDKVNFRKISSFSAVNENDADDMQLQSYRGSM